MGVFTNSGNSGFDSTNIGIIECAYEPGIEAAFAIVAESEQNYNALIQAVGMDELKFLEENGHEMVYTEATGSGFFEQAKAFFKNILEKIKGLFTKFFAMFDSFIKSDKEFINKYQKQLVQVDTKDFKYNGFEFTVDAITVDGADTAIGEIKKGDSELSAAIAEYKDETDVVEKWRGRAAKSSGSLTASEFSKELYEKFRKGESSKQELENLTAMKYIKILQDSSTAKKNAERGFTALRKTIEGYIKDVDQLSKAALSNLSNANAEENGTKARGAAVVVKMLKNKLAILQIVNGAKLTAIKDENRQARAILVKMLGYKPKNESTDFSGGYEGSRLSSLSFV